MSKKRTAVQSDGELSRQSEVKDRGSLHRYRTEIPNMVDDMDLSVYAFRLYVRLKRVAGDNGKCWESTRTLAERCNMAISTVSEAKQELVRAGLIEIEKRDNNQTDLITLVDIWPQNFAKYAPSQTDEGPKEECSPHEQGVRNTNKVFATKTQCSPHEQGVRHSAHKKNTIRRTQEKEPIEEERVVGLTPTPHPDTWDEFLTALCWVCHRHQDLSALTQSELGALTAEAKKLRDAGYTRADLRHWMEQYWYKDWRWKNGEQRPRPDMVRSMIPVLRENTYAVPASPGEEQPATTAPPAPPRPAAPPDSPWATCLQELQIALTPETFAWLTGSELVAAGEIQSGSGQLVPLYQVVVQASDGITWLTRQAGIQIRRRLSSILGHPVQIEIVAAEKEAV